MEIKASLRFLRMSPRKVRLIIDLIRGLSVEEADTRLRFVKKGASLPVLKLLRSAVANAEHNFKLDASTLRVKSITADGGPTLKRWMPRAQGRATPIRKRTAHINLVLTDEAKAPTKKETLKAAKAARPKKVHKKPARATAKPAETTNA
jgi:large subunit ribosomal protein L22